MDNKKVLTWIYILLLFSTELLFCQEPSIKWSFDTKDMAFGMAAMADVDRDGLPELVFSTYRNDERIIVLNAEDGSLLWEYNTGGCNDVAPLIYDVDLDGELEIILPGSCNPKTFCFDAASGDVEWVTDTHGSDSPPTVADIDNDGLPEILHGEFGGWVICINGEDGSVNWEFQVDANSWIQTAPTILDADLDGQLDFVVANWSFGDDHRIFAFRGDDHSLLWSSDIPEGVMYHGASHADIDDDGKAELVIGDYSGAIHVLNAEDGSLHWQFRFPFSFSTASPTNIADIDLDGDYEIVFFDWYQLGVLNHLGELQWKYDIPASASSFRGCALVDVNNDNFLDMLFGTSDGKVYGVNGKNGDQLWMMDLKLDFGEGSYSIDHAPVVGDFDDNGELDLFIVGGHAEYPNTEVNYGRAYAINLDGTGGPDWTMFRNNFRRTSCICPFTSSNANNLKEDNSSTFYYDAYRKRLNISHSFNSDPTCFIYNIQGMLIFKKALINSNEIDVSQLSRGTYILELRNRSGKKVFGRFMVY